MLSSVVDFNLLKFRNTRENERNSSFVVTFVNESRYLIYSFLKKLIFSIIYIISIYRNILYKVSNSQILCSLCRLEAYMKLELNTALCSLGQSYHLLLVLFSPCFAMDPEELAKTDHNKFTSIQICFTFIVVVIFSVRIYILLRI